MQRLINWLEIPVLDLARAKQFYSRVLGAQFIDMALGEFEYALFLVDGKAESGALAKGPGYAPSTQGVTIYLDGGPDMTPILERVVAAGGQVLMPKMLLSPEAGHIGFLLDSEGNRIGLQHP